MKTTEILDKKGNISSYGFACGYVEVKREGNSYKKLFKEHNTYHLIMMRGNERVIWLSYDSNKLAQARKDFNNTSLI
jgi:hypothetical protein